MTNTLNIIPNGIIDLRCKHFIPKRLISNQNIWIFTDKWFVKLKNNHLVWNETMENCP